MKVIPEIIRQVGFDFDWDEKKVWQLEEPVVLMDITELKWHFDVPFLGEDGHNYHLKPSEVMYHPEEHKEEYDRTLAAETRFPIDIMWNKGRWLILDGLHRLMKADISGEKTVQVRKIPRERIPEILKDV